jgi:hypothetical protein
MIDPVRFRDFWQTMIPSADRGPVVFERQTDAGEYSARPISTAWFRTAEVGEADASNGAYLTERLVWFVPRSLLPVQPVPGDRIRVVQPHKSAYPVAGKTFVVDTDGSRAVNAEGCWRMKTTRPYINPALAETINIYRKQPRRDDGGMVYDGTPTIVAGPLQAAVQVSDTFAVAPVQATEVFGKFQLPNPVRIFLDVIVRVQPEDYVVRTSDGQRYTVLNDSNVNRVGQFMSLDCVLHQ